MSEQTRQMTSRRPYLLRSLYEWILDNQCSPFLLVDCTMEGVQVPAQHIEDGRIVLNLNPSAIRGFEIADDGVYFSARFSGTPMNIIVPINAVLAIYASENGEGMVFGPSISADAAEVDEPDSDDGADQQAPAQQTAGGGAKKKAPVGLRSVSSGATAKASDKTSGNDHQGNSGPGNAKAGKEESSNKGPDDEPPKPTGPKGGGRPALRVVK